MTLQLSVNTRNERLDIIHSSIPTQPHLHILDGSIPADCASPELGTTLIMISLPTNWLATAVNGIISKNGIWQTLSADASGTATHFRIYDSAMTYCYMQGTVSLVGDGGDMILDAVVITAGQTATVTDFSITDGNP